MTLKNENNFAEHFSQLREIKLYTLNKLMKSLSSKQLDLINNIVIELQKKKNPAAGIFLLFTIDKKSSSASLYINNNKFLINRPTWA